MKITKTIERDVQFSASSPTLPARMWKFSISPIGVGAWPAGERKKARYLTWRELVTFLLIPGRGG